jgi:hypothetical protein
MPPLKSGQRGRLGACALWGLQRIEGASRAYLGCLHNSIDRTHQQFSDGVDSSLPGRSGRPMSQHAAHRVRFSKLIVSLRNALDQNSNIPNNILLAQSRSASRALLSRGRLAKIATAD